MLGTAKLSRVSQPYGWRQAHGAQRQSMVKRAAVKAGINAAVSPHWLRHAHGSHAIDREATLPEVQSTLVTAISPPRPAICMRVLTAPDAFSCSEATTQRNAQSPCEAYYPRSPPSLNKLGLFGALARRLRC